MQINPQRFERVSEEGARAFVEFMVSEEAQEIIRTFGVADYGEPLFVPDAGKASP
jgi:tungstate transport system substrate-binding protein